MLTGIVATKTTVQELHWELLGRRQSLPLLTHATIQRILGDASGTTVIPCRANNDIFCKPSGAIGCRNC
jgi:hypothetical protein